MRRCTSASPALVADRAPSGSPASLRAERDGRGRRRDRAAAPRPAARADAGLDLPDPGRRRPGRRAPTELAPAFARRTGRRRWSPPRARSRAPTTRPPPPAAARPGLGRRAKRRPLSACRLLGARIGAYDLPAHGRPQQRDAGEDRRTGRRECSRRSGAGRSVAGAVVLVITGSISAATTGGERRGERPDRVDQGCKPDGRPAVKDGYYVVKPRTTGSERDRRQDLHPGRRAEQLNPNLDPQRSRSRNCVDLVADGCKALAAG